MFIRTLSYILKVTVASGWAKHAVKIVCKDILAELFSSCVDKSYRSSGYLAEEAGRRGYHLCCAYSFGEGSKGPVEGLSCG